MALTVLIVLAPGFEEIEAITPIDVLRRAGAKVTVAGIDGVQVTGAHGITVVADTTMDEVDGLVDAVILPGGLPGAENLAKSGVLSGYLESMKAADRHIAAICAAPALVLAPAGILDKHQATCYPGFEEKFRESTRFSEARVVEDGKLTTSRGPGTALEFSLALVDSLIGSEVAEDLAKQMLAPSP